MVRYGMLFDLRKCMGCQTCVVACQSSNALRPGMAWSKVETVEKGRWPDGSRFFLPHACFHCDDPPCVPPCPTGASRKRSDGVVEVDYSICIGCGVCTTACPYGAREINSNPSWYYGASSPAPYEIASKDRFGVAEKCTLCSQRLDRDEPPACVVACPSEARLFGDLDDADSEIVQVAANGVQWVKGAPYGYIVGPHPFDVSAELSGMTYSPATEAVRSKEPVPDVGFLAISAVSAVALGIGVGAGVACSRRKKRK